MYPAPMDNKKALERAQKKVEARNFEIRKSLLKFDDVMNEQRKIIYSQRMEIIEDIEIDNLIYDMRDGFVDDFLENYQIDDSQLDDEKKKRFVKNLKVTLTSILILKISRVFKIFRLKILKMKLKTYLMII